MEKTAKKVKAASTPLKPYFCKEKTGHWNTGNLPTFEIHGKTSSTLSKFEIHFYTTKTCQK